MHHLTIRRRTITLPALVLLLSGVLATSVHAQQTLYSADQGSGNVYAFAPNGTRTTIASGFAPYSLAGIAVNRSGSVFFGDSSSGKIYQVTPSGTQTVFTSGFTGTINGLSFDSNGNLFVADGGTHSIVEITSGGVQSTFASGQELGSSGASFNDITFDRNGNLFVSNFNSGSFNNLPYIYEYTPIGVRSRFAAGSDTFSGGLAFNSSGSLFLADGEANSIYEYTPSGVQSTFATGLNFPAGLAIDSKGNLFVGNGAANNIVEITPRGIQSTFASGLNGVNFIALSPVPVPETGLMLSFALVGVMGAGWLARCKRGQ